MQRIKRLTIGNKVITISAIILVVFGSLMIASAEMGNSVGDTSYLSNIILKQVLYASAGVVAYFVIMNLGLYKQKLPFFMFFYFVIFFALISCRFFGQVNGAYAWISLGSFGTIQPSEFAKVLIIVLGANKLGTNKHEENLRNFKEFAIYCAVYFVIITFVQKDLGSAIVLLTISYCIMLIPPYKEIRKYQNWMCIGVVIVIGIICIALSKPVTDFLMNYSDNYMVGRFLAAADPFLYRYDNGYHVIMSLVSFANGGLFGLGYGNSIHKYMNFPNPSNDFILPVIVEELGIVGFIGFICLYGGLLIPIIINSIKIKYISSKMVLLGVFTYFSVHFILNVGGVSAIIPLTGVPLLLISSGGSSLVASMMALGFGQSEIIRNKYNEDEQ